jgi:hypothetical protein
LTCKKLAEETAIPSFVNGIMAELRSGPAFPDLFRICLMQSEATADQKLEYYAYSGGLIITLTQIHSFDMTSDSKDIAFVVSGTFLPASLDSVYGNKDTLLISGNYWEYDLASGNANRNTFFLGFSLDGASSAPNAIAQVEGSILNSYAVDVKDNVLRVATTVQQYSWYLWGYYVASNNVSAGVSRQECTAMNGTIVGDIGSFIIDYLCESNGKYPIAGIVPAESEAIVIEGEVCCGPAKKVVNRVGCAAINGTIVGDIGDGSIHRSDYVCESNGKAPIAIILPTDSGPTAISTEVCCGQKVVSRQECTALNGTVIGDDGDGAIHRWDYLCENNGEAPIATIVRADGELIAIDGEVCCGPPNEGTVVDGGFDDMIPICDCVTPPPVPPQETENYVITLDMAPSDGIMKELGRIKLGKPFETFTSVRFFDNVAYAGTFQMHDPLYTLDLSDALNPKKVSELDISGFSSYLHSINDNNTLILSIGEEADNNGTSLGIQITIFDMRDLTKPKVAQRLTIENDVNTYSYSDSQWDFKAFRYVNGKLIIPLDIYSWNQTTGQENTAVSFRGVAVFDATVDSIAEKCRISQSLASTYCYCGLSYLATRFMVFDGDLVSRMFA